MITTTERIAAVAEVIASTVARPIGIAAQGLIRLGIGCDYAWKHPYAEPKDRRRRVWQEAEIAEAFLNHQDTITIVNLHNLHEQILNLKMDMSLNGATKEEMERISKLVKETRDWYFDSHHISIRDLRWIHEMEDKYGND